MLTPLLQVYSHSDCLYWTGEAVCVCGAHARWYGFRNGSDRATVVEYWQWLHISTSKCSIWHCV